MTFKPNLIVSSVFICFFALWINCTGSFKKSFQTNSATDDSQKKTTHSCRSIENIKTLINQKQTELFNFFDIYQDSMINKDSLKAHIVIQANGEISCGTKPNTFFKDTSKELIKEIYSSSKTDLLCQCPTYPCTSFTIAKDSIVDKLSKIFSNERFISIEPCDSITVVNFLLCNFKDIKKLIISDTVYYYQTRSRKSIMAVVMSKTQAMRYAYNNHLRTDGNFSGKLTIKFAINELGNVIYVEIVGNTTKNWPFALDQMNSVKTWQFGKIDHPGDVTEVVYPFVFDR